MMPNTVPTKPTNGAQSAMLVSVPAPRFRSAISRVRCTLNGALGSAYGFHIRQVRCSRECSQPCGDCAGHVTASVLDGNSECLIEVPVLQCRSHAADEKTRMSTSGGEGIEPA